MDIKNIKIHVRTTQINRAVQDKLKKLGARWVGSGHIREGHKYRREDEPYLYCDNENILGYTSNGSDKFFRSSAYREVKAKELIKNYTQVKVE